MSLPFHGLAPRHSPLPKQLLTASHILVAASASAPLYRLPIDTTVVVVAPIKKRPTFVLPTVIMLFCFCYVIQLSWYYFARCLQRFQFCLARQFFRCQLL